MKNSNLTPFLLTILTFALVACEEDGQQVEQKVSSSSVRGTVTYRERIALTPEAIVEVELVDISRADTPAQVVVAEKITNPGQVPIAFELSYDPGEIDTRRSYAVQARIRVGDWLEFVTDEAHLVLTHEHPDELEIVLRRASIQDTPSEFAEQDAEADAIGERLSGLRSVEGHWRLSDATATYRAFFDGESLVYIEEERTLGDYGDGRVEFHFREGRLFRYHERSHRRIIDPSLTPELREIIIRMYFHPDGRYAGGYKNMDDKPQDEPDVQEALGAVGYAEALKEEAQDLAFGGK